MLARVGFFIGRAQGVILHVIYVVTKSGKFNGVKPCPSKPRFLIAINMILLISNNDLCGAVILVTLTNHVNLYGAVTQVLLLGQCNLQMTQ